jgi:hypothetical protein
VTTYWALELLRDRHVILHTSDCNLFRRLQAPAGRDVVSAWHGPFSDITTAACVATELDPLSSERPCDCCEGTRAFQQAWRRHRAERGWSFGSAGEAT